ncbi:ABC-2 type transport system ATP-binding protein [Diaminobutyricimonas aerilata]|uniref:ABC-2 type transport system ATP-binding protein n=1 Tax=Diaminobutyricimonas aerilata TaxID=1162967 RepID=A0A2M9CLY6_9MICO|nr:ABC transporter ATP-binding protein [Diaminobutyricimonas aerilata]PJJ72899.1 ABC-2 type transport system ATP-binding protein [Diaminobutyricimonas aerilata]
MALEHPVDVRAVARRFGRTAGVNGIDLTVAHGEIHALVGLNGAGKSTLLRLILGMLRPEAGSVRVAGSDVARGGSWSRVGHLIDAPLAYPAMTVRQNLRAVATLHGIPRSLADERIAGLSTEFRLDEYLDVRFGRLSLGNRQRLGLAAALVHEPEVIVLDEPGNALDPSGVILLRNALASRAARGSAVLVSSHHLDEVARIAHRITVINRGRVIGSLAPDAVDIERAFFSLVLADEEASS